MRWFTAAWASGGLSDEEHEARHADYRMHFEAIRGQLPPALVELGTTLSIHDGQVRQWSLTSDGLIVIEALVGDIQVGYQQLTLTYHNAELIAPAPTVLAKWIADPHTELLYDEVDVEGDLFEHRILVWLRPRRVFPRKVWYWLGVGWQRYGDLTIRFGNLTIGLSPASPPDRHPV